MRAAEGERGTVYVVSVSGDKFCEQGSRDYTAAGLTHTSTYQTIDIRGGRLTYRSLDADGREVDAPVIEKPVAHPRGLDVARRDVRLD